MDFPRVQDQINVLAEHWEKECLNIGHSIYAKASTSDTRRWRHPPLLAKIKSDTLSLDGLLRDFYYQPSGDVEVIEAWDEAMSLLLVPHSGHPIGAMNRAFKRVFPEITFGGDVTHPLNNAAQFLMCASWHNDRKLDCTSSKCMLTVGGKTIGINRRGLFLSDGGHRTRTSLPDYRLPLRSLRGGAGRRPAFPHINGAYRLLMRALPHLANEIEIGFSVAVQMGAETEKLILKHLDIVIDDDAETPSDTDVLYEARILVETCLLYTSPSPRD